MNNYIGVQVDRSFLYLIVIYVIHGFLLHHFLIRPQLEDIKINLNIAIAYTPYDLKKFITEKNSSIYDTAELKKNVLEEYKVENFSNDKENDYISQHLILTRKLSYQRINGATAYYPLLSKPKTRYATAPSFGIMMLKNMGPAVSGIILGSIVFFFTFSDNI